MALPRFSCSATNSAWVLPIRQGFLTRVHHSPADVGIEFRGSEVEEMIFIFNNFSLKLFISFMNVITLRICDFSYQRKQRYSHTKLCVVQVKLLTMFFII